MNGFTEVQTQAESIGLVAEEQGFNVFFYLPEENTVGYSVPMADFNYLDSSKKTHLLRTVRRQLESAFNFNVY